MSSAEVFILTEICDGYSGSCPLEVGSPYIVGIYDSFDKAFIGIKDEKQCHIGSSMYRISKIVLNCSTDEQVLGCWKKRRDSDILEPHKCDYYC